MPLPGGGWALFGLELLAAAVCGLVAGRGRARTGLAVALSLGLFVFPFLVPDGTSAIGFLRMLLAAGSAVTLMRCIDLGRSRPISWGRRVWLMLAVFDVRRNRYVVPGLHGASLLKMAVFGPLALAGAWLVYRAASFGGGAALALRWIGGLVFTYAAFEAVEGSVRVSYRLAGIDPPAVHVQPIMARSLREFWGERWNLIIRDLFNAILFRPVARRAGVRVGVIATFIGSALLHAWMIGVALRDVWMTLSMAGFFLIQGVAMVIERRLGTARWPSWGARMYTIGALLLPSPLFVEPQLRALLPT